MQLGFWTNLSQTSFFILQMTEDEMFYKSCYLIAKFDRY